MTAWSATCSAGWHCRSPRSRRGPVAAQRRGRHLRDADGRGARPHRSLARRDTEAPTPRPSSRCSRASAASANWTRRCNAGWREVEQEEEATSALGAEVATLRGAAAALEAALQARQAERLAGDKDLEQATREHERLDRHRETLRFESSQVTREAEETAQTLDGSRAPTPACPRGGGAARNGMATLRAAIETSLGRERRAERPS